MFVSWKYNDYICYVEKYASIFANNILWCGIFSCIFKNCMLEIECVSLLQYWFDNSQYISLGVYISHILFSMVQDLLIGVCWCLSLFFSSVNYLSNYYFLWLYWLSDHYWLILLKSQKNVPCTFTQGFKKTIFYSYFPIKLQLSYFAVACGAQCFCISCKGIFMFLWGPMYLYLARVYWGFG